MLALEEWHVPGAQMSTDHPAYEPSAWRLLVERIGSGLRNRYRPSEELPPTLWTLLGRLETKLAEGKTPDCEGSESAD
jgi:hypothetical protein